MSIGPENGDSRDRRPRVTIYEVARAAGVSHATVSRVLNGSMGVSIATRTAVEFAVARTGYVPNLYARRLAGGRPNTVIFLHCIDNSRLFVDPVINDLVLTCGRAFSDRDIMTIVPVSGGESAGTVARRLTATIADPVLLFGAPRASETVSELVGRGLPLVACGTPLGHEQSVSFVTTNDRDGASEMVKYLRSLGRRRIATITGPMDLPGSILRMAGYRDAMGDSDPALVANGDFSCSSGMTATAQLLRQAPDLDAIFVASDMMAVGALAALERAGRLVPEDVAVAGFDDAPVAMTVRPRLTTVRIPWQRYPGELVRQVLRRMDGDSPSGVVLPVELVIREST